MDIETNSESNPIMELSDTPLSQADGLKAIMGLDASTDDVEQAEDDSPLEASIEDEVEEELEESSEEEVELEASDEVSVDEDTIELDDSEYEYLTGIKDWAEAEGFTDIEQLRGGVLMQSKFTQNTQEHAAAVKAHNEAATVKTQELAQGLELAQAILYGQAAEFDHTAMQELRETDPHAYQDKLEAFMDYTTKKTQVDEQIAKVTAEHQQQQAATREQTIVDQTALFQQMVPDAADPVKAAAISDSITEYWVGNGYDPAALNDVTGALELKVLMDAARNTSVSKEVKKAKAPAPKKKGKRLLRGGSPKSGSAKQRASKKAAKEGLANAGTSVESKQLGTDMILNMIANGEL